MADAKAADVPVVVVVTPRDAAIAKEKEAALAPKHPDMIDRRPWPTTCAWAVGCDTKPTHWTDDQLPYCQAHWEQRNPAEPKKEPAGKAAATAPNPMGPR